MRIETYQDYLYSLKALANCDTSLLLQRFQLEKPAQELTPDQVERCLQPLRCFRQCIVDDILDYEKIVEKKKKDEKEVSGEEKTLHPEDS